MLSVLAGCFLAVSDSPLAAAAAASAFWKVCGEQAYQSAKHARGGTGSFHTALFDEASLLCGRQVRALSRVRRLEL